ncbi:MAG: hypothetical protein US52_C0035G0002 [candidate division WS6 bacterium GW2011_GWA2_37_6]|uniref:Uncharacterized protein n=1 Tax=candidate division WS6 bacterium GW2011_GWA2_37_6 TaxID=1619087 RepID=A0A0G0JEE9_9BACT|nr:MAG: hypothetical protein US52_C0035G0002 [candidate division WS6 bacterium GW2011_GWA2_37_6]
MLSEISLYDETPTTLIVENPFGTWDYKRRLYIRNADQISGEIGGLRLPTTSNLDMAISQIGRTWPIIIENLYAGKDIPGFMEAFAETYPTKHPYTANPEIAVELCLFYHLTPYAIKHMWLGPIINKEIGFTKVINLYNQKFHNFRRN